MAGAGEKIKNLRIFDFSQIPTRLEFVTSQKFGTLTEPFWYKEVRPVPETVRTNANNREEAKKKGNGAFWSAIAILILLLLLSLVILSIQLHSFMSADSRVLSLKANTDVSFDIFSVTYRNVSGEIIVSGMNGEKVVAPGTSVDYSVRVRNADTVAIDYTILPKVKFDSPHPIPILVRVIGPDETYLAGDAKTWLPLEELNRVSETATLTKGEAVEYVFQWMWPFESGDDPYDTFLGSNVFEENIGVTVSFGVHAEANTSLQSNGGVFGELYGMSFYLLLFFILLLIAIVILLIYKLRRRRREKNSEWTNYYGTPGAQ